MPRYLLSVRHFDNDYRIDEPEACNCQMTRPRVSSLQGKELEGMDDGGHAGGRRVWRLAFGATLSGDYFC